MRRMQPVITVLSQTTQYQILGAVEIAFMTKQKKNARKVFYKSYENGGSTYIIVFIVKDQISYHRTSLLFVLF